MTPQPTASTAVYTALRVLGEECPKRTVRTNGSCRLGLEDANGQALAYLCSRENEAEARQAKVLTADEARRIAINIARLPELLGRARAHAISDCRGTSDRRAKLLIGF
jgi:hypothetical protein